MKKLIAIVTIILFSNVCFSQVKKETYLFNSLYHEEDKEIPHCVRNDGLREDIEGNCGGFAADVTPPCLQNGHSERSEETKRNTKQL